MALALNVLSDYAESLFRGFAFYISESLLFATFWLLFLPLLQLQVYLLGRIRRPRNMVMLSVAMISLHLLVYPLVVWVLSALCYGHTFTVWQTLAFGFTEHFTKLVIVYSFSLLFYRLSGRQAEASVQSVPAAVVQPGSLRSILVPDGTSGNVVLDVADILAFTASPPYIRITHRTRPYLLTGTLRSLEKQLDPTEFIRIHKSHIIRIGMVTGYRSRGNGDYDLTLADGSVWRVSRNYARDFLGRFGERHRLVPK
jgi:DNA-binding LytR/AlgR family response regulator